MYTIEDKGVIKMSVEGDLTPEILEEMNIKLTKQNKNRTMPKISGVVPLIPERIHDDVRTRIVNGITYKYYWNGHQYEEGEHYSRRKQMEFTIFKE